MSVAPIALVCLDLHLLAYYFPVYLQDWNLAIGLYLSSNLIIYGEVLLDYQTIRFYVLNEQVNPLLLLLKAGKCLLVDF